MTFTEVMQGMVELKELLDDHLAHPETLPEQKELAGITLAVTLVALADHVRALPEPFASMATVLYAEISRKAQDVELVLFAQKKQQLREQVEKEGDPDGRLKESLEKLDQILISLSSEV